MSFSLDFNFTDFMLPPDRSTRSTFRERERPIVAAQSNAGTHLPQARHRRRDPDRRRANGLTRLQQVGQSLERLNDVISEGATLDSLNTAVEALRAGLGRLDVNSGNGERRPDGLTRQRVDEADDGTGDRQEDEEMERLEVLVCILEIFTEKLTKEYKCLGGPNVGFDTSSADECSRRRNRPR